jgi:hypothetical protein
MLHKSAFEMNDTAAGNRYAEAKECSFGILNVLALAIFHYIGKIYYIRVRVVDILMGN